MTSTGENNMDWLSNLGRLMRDHKIDRVDLAGVYADPYLVVLSHKGEAHKTEIRRQAVCDAAGPMRVIEHVTIWWADEYGYTLQVEGQHTRDATIAEMTFGVEREAAE